MTLEQNDNEIEIAIKEPEKKAEPILSSNEIKPLPEKYQEAETPIIEKKSPQEEKAAAKKAAQEKKEAAKKAAQEKKEAAKKAAQEKKAAAKKAATEEKKPEVELPAYFSNKYPDYQDEKKAEQEALLWFLGLDKDKKPVENSYSAKITYVGSKRVTSKNLRIARRAIIPNFGNWKLSQGAVRFFKKRESTTLIKDPIFIKEALSTTNYKVRIIIDQKINKKELKSKHFARDDARILGLKPRLRRDMIAMGQKPPLHPGEAKQFLEELSNNPNVRKDLFTEDQKKWLQSKIKEDNNKK